MKRYVVIFEDSAQADVRKSYDWGCRAWGKREAHQWAARLRDPKLTAVPEGATDGEAEGNIRGTGGGVKLEKRKS